MGILQYNNKKSIIDSIVNDVAGGGTVLYAFISNMANTTPMNNSVKTSQSSPQYDIQFGKRILSSDIKAVIKNNIWSLGEIYDRYDDEDINLYNKKYYVVTPPTIIGGYRHVFKCISNNDGAQSVDKPDILQIEPFTKSDGYIWKYMFSVSQAEYDKFGTDQYIPVTGNTTVQQSGSLSGIDDILVENTGINYITHNEGTIRSIQNNTCIQIDLSASQDNDFYKNSSIYMSTGSNQMGQLLEIQNYVSNTSGKWVITKTTSNTSLIFPGLTSYSITPTVKITGNGTTKAKAYPVIANNQITDIIIIDRGTGYTHADAKIIANTSYGSAAQLRVIVPPPGGHGANPEAELAVQGYCISFNFNGSEIPFDNTYSVIGLIKNPKTAANNTLVYQGNTFNQLLKGSISSNTAFIKNEIVTGETSGRTGRVYFANSTQIFMVGDKAFANSEIITSESGNSTTITINTRGDLNSKELEILYTQSINQISRTSTQKESYKIIVQV